MRGIIIEKEIKHLMTLLRYCKLKVSHPYTTTYGTKRIRNDSKTDNKTHLKVR